MGDLRYADAGVDIDAGNRAIDLIRRAVSSTHTPSVLGGIGAFSGLFELDVSRWRRPVLVSSTDSVGTKVKVAIATNRHRGIGVDLVNHCVNDVLCCGAEPLFFLDYYATGKLVPEHLAEVVDGLAAACRDAGCALVGGETAEMPGVYALADYDIAGFIVGAVERDGIVDGSRVEAGDVLLALPSSGLHTNGYSLVRHIVLARELDWADPLPGTEQPLADLLLEPHRSYLHAVTELRNAVDVRAMAHITGGGLIENVPRVLPAGLSAVIDRSSWEVPPLFSAIERVGGVMPEEMWRTFNMGVGMVLAVPRGQAATVASAAGLPVWRIGEVIESAGGERVRLG
ncbi:MAG TPA: phosphoribosylformylglycinamidine cyclo-ligase [Candidatus Dormibacteraeota bacterium]|nr:phosphoribosylformylglycinamidine cyclo-ligase [Candidatus Dormibacteraeota bacterium]